MPSPILKFTSGTFENAKSGIKIGASKKNPVYAYRRRSGAWKFTPRGKKRKAFNVSIVLSRKVGISTISRDRRRASRNPAPVKAPYRHTGDWVRSDGRVVSQGWPTGKGRQPAKKKPKGAKSSRKTTYPSKAAAKESAKKGETIYKVKGGYRVSRKK